MSPIWSGFKLPLVSLFLLGLVNLGELIELDDELLEDPMVASLSRMDVDAQNFDDRSQNEEEKNNEGNLIAMQ